MIRRIKTLFRNLKLLSQYEFYLHKGDGQIVDVDDVLLVKNNNANKEKSNSKGIEDIEQIIKDRF